MGANQSRKIAIVGGGIAGLSAALAFAKHGATVTVYEQSDELREVGAGLQITPNGAAVLAALGLTDKADQRAIRARAVVPRDAIGGMPLARFDLSDLRGQPYRFFHRADLLEILAGAARDLGVTVQTSARITAVDTQGPTPALVLADGSRVTSDLILGADGLHSRLRPVLNGDDAPFFTGQVAWRSVVSMPGFPSEATIWMAPGRHVVTYPLTDGRLNIVAVQERKTWAAEGWNFFDEPTVVQAVFADCAPALRDLLGRIETVRLWGLFRHPVAAQWWGPGMAILGDAAHPTLPFLAQGANLALEDAWVLARVCDASPDLDAGLATYQALRRPRVLRAIAGANANAVNYHLSGARRQAAHLGLRAIGLAAPGAFLRRMDWLYGHDVTA